MRLFFWLSLFGVLWAYAGYALVLWLMSHVRPKPVAAPVAGPATAQGFLPTVSVLIAAHNEEKALQSKVDNLLQLDYPKDRLQIVIVSDGSTDRTAEILLANRSVLCPVILEHAEGKAFALNEARRHATGEILVFFDVRQRIAPNAISALTGYFIDPQVGAVSGELLLDASATAGATDGLGIYWRLEKLIRRLESASGSVVGVTGAIYAIRGSLFKEMPRGTILDDVFVPMNIAQAGKRILFCPSAVAYDQLSEVRGREFSRKVRTLTGNYQLLDLQPWLLTAANPLRLRFISHKLMRLVVPWCLLLMLFTSFRATGEMYRLAFWAQVCLYLCALLGVVWPDSKRLRPVAIAYTFAMLNAAAAIAFYNFALKRYRVWV